MVVCDECGSTIVQLETMGKLQMVCPKCDKDTLTCEDGDRIVVMLFDHMKTDCSMQQSCSAWLNLASSFIDTLPNEFLFSMMVKRGFLKPR